MSARGAHVEGLMALDARAWAQLLRALRSRGDLTTQVADALAIPSGELSSGRGRRALCEAVDADERLLADLRADSALPAAVHDALSDDDSDGDVGHAPGSGAPADARGTSQAVGTESERTEERARALRRSLDDERRRREGAEARATSAESRSVAVTAERDAARARVVELEAELARANEVVAQAAARAERRSSSRADGLERELAAERSAHAALRRELDRVRSDLSAARAEIDELRARRRADVSDPSVAPGGRPLVLPGSIQEGTTEAARWLAARARLLIIDGYNATLTLRPDRPLEEQRRWLVERLRPLVVRGAARPVVIFDGDRSTGRMSDTGGVEVRFSSGGVIADDEIVFAVAGTDDAVLVITDDVELSGRVRAEGGNVVGVVHLAGIVDG